MTWLSRHLGHSTLKVTTDSYGHWERSERKRHAENDGWCLRPQLAPGTRYVRAPTRRALLKP
jgi:hypothetical protein